MSRVGDRLAVEIANKGWIQYQAATELGVSRYSVNELVNGKRTLTPEMAVRLEIVFGVAAEAWLKWQMADDLVGARAYLREWTREYDRSHRVRAKMGRMR